MEYYKIMNSGTRIHLDEIGIPKKACVLIHGPPGCLGNSMKMIRHFIVTLTVILLAIQPPFCTSAEPSGSVTYPHEDEIINSSSVNVSGTAAGSSNLISWNNDLEFNAGSNVNVTVNGGLKLQRYFGNDYFWVKCSDGPSEVFDAACVWNSRDNFMIVFGGTNNMITARNETLFYFPNNDTWMNLGNASISSRFGSAVVWDNENNRMLLYGGQDNWNVFNETWAYYPGNNTWEQLATGPRARFEATAIWDTTDNCMIMIGGSAYMWTCNETWVYQSSNNTWSQKANYPSWNITRSGGAWNNNSKQAIFYGGAIGENALAMKEVWIYYLSNDTWFKGNDGTPRWGHSMVWDNNNERVIIHGGYNEAKWLNDTWCYYPSNDSWCQLADGPIGRSRGMGCWDNENRQLIVYGGASRKDTATFSPPHIGEGYSIGISKLSTNSSHYFCSLRYDGKLKDGCNVSFQVRTSDDNSSWSKWYNVTNSSIPSLKGKYIQWFALLNTTNPGYSPFIQKIEAIWNYAVTTVEVTTNSTVSSRGWVAATGYENWNATLTGLADGYYRIIIRVTDSIDSIQTINGNAMAVDTNSPASEAYGLEQFSRNRSLLIYYNATDMIAGVEKVQLWYRLNSTGNYAFAGNYSSSPIKFNTTSDGNYEFYTLARDAVGNWESPPISADDSTCVDTVAPTTSDDAPDGWARQNVTINLTAKDGGSGVRETFYRVNGGCWTTGSLVNIESEGNNTFEYYSNDNACNMELVTTRQVRVDKTGPVSKILTAPAYSNTKIITLYFDAADNISGIKFVEVWYNHDGDVERIGTFSASPISFIAQSDGKYGFFSIAMDNAQNKELKNQNETSVIIDTAAPISSDSVSPNWSRTPVIVTIASTDSISGIEGTIYRIDNGTWTCGTIVTISGDGTHYLYYYSVDKAGNKETVRTNIVRIDGTSPISQISALPKYFGNRILTIYFDTYDATSGIKSVGLWYKERNSSLYSLYGNFTSSPCQFIASIDGIYDFYSRAWDNAGNQEDEPTEPDISVVIDTQKPSTSDDGPAFWSTGPVVITLLPKDSLSGINGTYYRLDKLDWTLGTRFEISKEGVYIINYYSTDNSGNSEDIKCMTVRIDLTPPESRIERLPVYFASYNIMIHFKSTDATSGTGLVELWYRQKGSGPYSMYGDFEASPALFIASSNGTYELYTRARDVAGNYESAHINSDVELTIDTLPPSTSVYEPVNWSNKPVKVEFDSIDDVGVSATYYSINGGIWNKYNGSFDITEDGIHNLAYYSIDLAGNSEPVRNLTVMIDRVSPITWLSPIAQYSRSRQIPLYFEWRDNISGLAFVELLYSFNGTPYQKYQDSFSSSPIPFVASSDGEYKFMIVGTDNAGNKEKNHNVPDSIILLDTIAPGPVITIKEGEVTESANIHMAGKVEPGTTVVINGAIVNVDQNGRFDKTFNIIDGTNIFSINATDPAGNSITIVKTVKRTSSPILSFAPWIIITILLAVIGMLLASSRCRLHILSSDDKSQPKEMTIHRAAK
jgi:hypothetical protein